MTVKLDTHTTTHTTYDKSMTPIDFQGRVKGQGHTLYSVVKLCKHDTDWTVSARTVKLDTHTTHDKRKTPIDFQGRVKGQGHTLYSVVKPCKHDTDWTL